MAMTANRSAAQTFALLVAGVFLLVGILGFIPGVVTDHDTKFIGQDGDSELLGIFQINILHNLVHLLFGLAGFALARTWEGARNFLIGGGVVYLLLWILGLAGGADWIPANDADDWLHLLLGIGMIGLGIATTRGGMARERTAV